MHSDAPPTLRDITSAAAIQDWAGLSPNDSHPGDPSTIHPISEIPAAVMNDRAKNLDLPQHHGVVERLLASLKHNEELSNLLQAERSLSQTLQSYLLTDMEIINRLQDKTKELESQCKRKTEHICDLERVNKDNIIDYHSISQERDEMACYVAFLKERPQYLPLSERSKSGKVNEDFELYMWDVKVERDQYKSKLEYQATRVGELEDKIKQQEAYKSDLTASADRYLNLTKKQEEEVGTLKDEVAYLEDHLDALLKYAPPSVQLQEQLWKVVEHARSTFGPEFETISTPWAAEQLEILQAAPDVCDFWTQSIIVHLAQHLEAQSSRKAEETEEEKRVRLAEKELARDLMFRCTLKTGQQAPRVAYVQAPMPYYTSTI
ncbi:hypothetical protein L202_03105 [Cryptococcus amylolentus CBS 6039]|uniref:Uncharacterized protein n=1 Tax=Cryptococcus amylolentus CBS 6039 TaxID=1295533 RepID=A0A1E3HZ28_9TREE|nr:hypothetical protein L202_03105 [Cryptococcus amylolentus CBS 6039]ODN80996.1 hypothetical protein L202_03105 [Cryptococcus amylolentus CBS 6039]